MDTKKLRELAKVATPGPWEVWTSNSVRRITAHGQQDGGVLSAVTNYHDGLPDLYGRNRDRDLAFIAAANPQTVIALGDILHLREWYPHEISNVITGDSPTDAYIAKFPPHYTGRELDAQVTYMTNGGEWGLPKDLCVMALSIGGVKEP